jgi:hypothetical protein
VLLSGSAPCNDVRAAHFVTGIYPVKFYVEELAVRYKFKGSVTNRPSNFTAAK